jgi:hypothetical protein
VRTSAAYRTAIWVTRRHVAPFLYAFLFVYLGITLTSHLAFNMQDAAGWVWEEKPVTYELKGLLGKKVPKDIPECPSV